VAVAARGEEEDVAPVYFPVAEHGSGPPWSHGKEAWVEINGENLGWG
jgi:hypothetical protein